RLRPGTRRHCRAAREHADPRAAGAHGPVLAGLAGDGERRGASDSPRRLSLSRRRRRTGDARGPVLVRSAQREARLRDLRRRTRGAGHCPRCMRVPRPTQQRSGARIAALIAARSVGGCHAGRLRGIAVRTVPAPEDVESRARDRRAAPRAAVAARKPSKCSLTTPCRVWVTPRFGSHPPLTPVHQGPRSAVSPPRGVPCRALNPAAPPPPPSRQAAKGPCFRGRHGSREVLRIQDPGALASITLLPRRSKQSCRTATDVLAATQSRFLFPVSNDTEVAPASPVAVRFFEVSKCSQRIAEPRDRRPRLPRSLARVTPWPATYRCART